MSDPVQCELCECMLSVHESYVVRIEVFADPSLPPMTAEEVAAADFEQTLSGLLDEMQHMSADELQDGVHRRFEYRLCPRCHRRYLINPLGKPRNLRASKN